MIGPIDMELHKGYRYVFPFVVTSHLGFSFLGTDQRLYLVDLARLLPPYAVTSNTRAIFLPAQKSTPISEVRKKEERREEKRGREEKRTEEQRKEKREEDEKHEQKQKQKQEEREEKMKMKRQRKRAREEEKERERKKERVRGYQEQRERERAKKIYHSIETSILFSFSLLVSLFLSCRFLYRKNCGKAIGRNPSPNFSPLFLETFPESNFRIWNPILFIWIPNQVTMEKKTDYLFFS